MRCPKTVSLSRSLMAIALVVVPACTRPDGGAGEGEGEGEGKGEGEGEGEGPAVDAVAYAAAAALCDALFRCCPSEEELARFFIPVTSGDPQGVFADVIPQLPPNGALAADDCPAIVATIHGRKGIGPFALAAAAGELDYDPTAAQACLTTLDEAACGADVATALYDGTCFGLSAPLGGDEQRSMFRRTSTEGTCHPLADGFGGIFFGTCDPTRSFCCIDDGNGECGFGGVDDEGTCVPAAQAGEVCSTFAPVLLCATGLECIPGEGPGGADGCVAMATGPLAEGEPCYDEASFRLLGECVDAWCDATGSNVCEPRRADGQQCQTPDQCLSLGCVEGVCGVDDFCSGP
jgi:hypothetical protein